MRTGMEAIVTAGMVSREKLLRIAIPVGVIVLITLWIMLPFFTSKYFRDICDEETNQYVASQYVSWKNGFEDVKNFRKATATNLSGFNAGIIVARDVN